MHNRGPIVSPKKIIVRKTSGREEVFNEDKLYKSLIRSGASKKLANSVISKVHSKLKSGMTTHQIRKQAYQMLKRESKRLAADYRLNRAILELGPDGFLFERFIAGLLDAKGYKTETNVVKKGKCVNHEIDILAEKDHRRIFIECKFHNALERTNDVKVALYVWARWKDLEANPDVNIDEFWLISNTKFSKDAIDYANCSGLNIIGENLPNHQAISRFVSETGMHPLTCLSSIRKSQKNLLIKEGKLFARDLLEDPKVLSKIGLADASLFRVIEEIESLSHHYKGQK